MSSSNVWPIRIERAHRIAPLLLLLLWLWFPQKKWKKRPPFRNENRKNKLNQWCDRKWKWLKTVLPYFRFPPICRTILKRAKLHKKGSAWLIACFSFSATFTFITSSFSFSFMRPVRFPHLSPISGVLIHWTSVSSLFLFSHQRIVHSYESAAAYGNWVDTFRFRHTRWPCLPVIA